MNKSWVTKEEMIRARRAEILAALRPEHTSRPNPRRDRALARLRDWFPTGGMIYLVRRRKGKLGNMLIDCVRVAEGKIVPSGLVVADALERSFSHEHERTGFKCFPNEIPAIFTGSLSMLLYGERGKLQVELL